MIKTDLVLLSSALFFTELELKWPPSVQNNGLSIMQCDY